MVDTHPPESRFVIKMATHIMLVNSQLPKIHYITDVYEQPCDFISMFVKEEVHIHTQDSIKPYVCPPCNSRSVPPSPLYRPTTYVWTILQQKANDSEQNTPASTHLCVLFFSNLLFSVSNQTCEGAVPIIEWLKSSQLCGQISEKWVLKTQFWKTFCKTASAHPTKFQNKSLALSKPQFQHFKTFFWTYAHLFSGHHLQGFKPGTQVNTVGEERQIWNSENVLEKPCKKGAAVLKKENLNTN